MSRDPSLQLLLRAARHDSLADESWLDQIIQKELLSVSSTLPEWHNTSCLLQDLGNFLARTTTILSRLADHVVNGDQLHAYAEGRIREMDEVHDFSELDSLVYLEEKHRSLKSIASNLVTTADLINSVWRTSAMNRFTSRRETRDQRQQSGDTESTVMSDSTSAMESPVPIVDQSYEAAVSVKANPCAITIPMAPESHTPAPPPFPPINTSPKILQPMVVSPIVEELPQFPSTPRPSYPEEHNPDARCQLLLKELTGRGTGQYYCPWGAQCTKGGSRDDQVVVFERNSAFRAHLQKHGKLFRCELAGCNAKGGFARIDQLRRHQDTVPHSK